MRVFIIAIALSAFFNSTTALADCEDNYNGCITMTENTAIGCMQDGIDSCEDLYPNCPGLPNNNQCPQSNSCKLSFAKACHNQMEQQQVVCEVMYSACSAIAFMF